MIYSNFYVLLVIKIIKKVICFFFAIQMLNSFQFIASSYAMESDAIQISQRLESLMEETARNTIIRLAFIKDNPSDFAQFMQDNLDSLATEDTFSIVRGLYTYYFVTSDLKNTIESSPWYPQYQPFLERYISHDNTVIRQMTSLVRAATLDKQTRYQITQNDMYEEAEALLNEVKKFAAKRKTSVSEMVENYFRTITKPKRKKLSEILDELPRINIPANKKLSDLYFDAKMKENNNEQ